MDSTTSHFCMLKSTLVPTSAPKQMAATSTTRKISFPLGAVFQSAVQDGENNEVWRILSHHSNDLDINQPNHVGLTALHQGVLNNNLDSVKILVTHGAHVNAADMNGFTPLHTAAACGYMQLTSMLLLQGADVFQLTHDGDLPVDLAKDSATARLLTDEMLRQIHQRTYLSAWIMFKARELFAICSRVTLQVLDLLGQFMEKRHQAKQLRCGIHRPLSLDMPSKKVADNRPKLSSIDCQIQTLHVHKGPSSETAESVGDIDVTHFKED